MRRKRKFKLSLKLTYVLSAIVMALATFLIYYYSFDARMKVMACTGNYYYSDSQIFDIAKVNSASRSLLTPSFLVERNLRADPLIESAKVTKNKDRILLDVKEKTVIGYFVKNGKNYVLTNEGETIELDQKYLKNIIHFPLMSDFTDQQLENIWKEFAKYPKLLTRGVVEKIAEMVPYASSYDANMIKMTMQDGNVVYTSVADLMMMSRYEDMLSQLRGQSVCLVLDAQNSTINKLDCAYLNMSLEEREAKRKEEAERKKQEEEERKRAEAEKKAQEEAEKKAQSESGEQQHSEENGEQPSEDNAQPPEEAGVEEETEDWVLMPDSGMLYSASQNLYQDPSTGAYYYWDEEAGFVATE
ncbi:cell division protein FtsQ/DivIB [Dubosiella muris]|uniref:Uncharacterized protein n=2 Tax=Dubosiella TaxID=1937008 RepID=A0AC61R6X8_9FIRM|nr:hypothetical protein [Dubosiella muris]TGY65433.1 hypothetical protein E5336_08415 [Dubosiella muris]